MGKNIGKKYKKKIKYSQKIIELAKQSATDSFKTNAKKGHSRNSTGRRFSRETTRRKEKEVIFKNCALFTNCMSIINNIQIDNAKDPDVVMPMYKLLEYINHY